MSVLAQHKHTFSDHACLRLLRAKLTTALLDKLPRVVREQVFMISIEAASAPSSWYVMYSCLPSVKN